MAVSDAAGERIVQRRRTSSQARAASGEPARARSLQNRVSAENVLPGSGQNIQSIRSPFAAPNGTAKSTPREPLSARKNARDFGEATRLAREYHLDLYEVKSILNEFRICSSKGLDKEEFRKLLGKVMDMKEKVPDELLQSAWHALIRAGSGDMPGEDGGLVPWEVSIDSFFQWYTGNMFSHVTPAKQTQSDEMVHRLAREHGVDATIIDKVKKRFDEFDTNGSGDIDFKEFLSMLCVLLRARSRDDLSEKRVFRFWKEIDRDSSGSVSFEEFCEWYLKYFEGGDERDSVAQLADPVGQFYQSFDPQVQRRKSVEKTLEAYEIATSMLDDINTSNVPRKRGSI
jgi:hypothetical protein